MDKPNVNLFFIRHLFFIAIIWTSFSPLQNTYAEAVPVVQESIAKKAMQPVKKIQKEKRNVKQNHYKQKHQSKKHKKHPKKNTEDGFNFFWILAIWYSVFVAMLIVGILLSIAAVWITAVVFLCLPVLIGLILLIIFLAATHGAGGFSLC